MGAGGLLPAEGEGLDGLFVGLAERGGEYVRGSPRTESASICQNDRGGAFEAGWLFGDASGGFVCDATEESVEEGTHRDSRIA